MATVEQIRQRYAELFDGQPRVFRSPGRINIIGEHTDYNNGFVLPAGVDKAVYFAIAPREDEQVVLHALDLNESYQCALNDWRKPEQGWAWFQLGVLDQLTKQQLPVRGFQVVFGGDIPAGAGMSSSAALECCLLYALNALFELGLDRLQIAKMAQKAENEYVGLNCGIMDQFASVFAQEGKVIRLDCQTLEYTYFPFRLSGYSLVLCDTTVKHSLATSEYNTRRAECERGVAILKKYYPTITSLRDVTTEQVAHHRLELGDVLYRRCKFITSELLRVLEACESLAEDNAQNLGALMYATHDGLQFDYEVSCPELDFLVGHTRGNPDIAGARMMGGGFGGCTINLVKTPVLEDFEKDIKQAYSERFGRDLPCYRVRIGNGTEEVLS